MADSVPASDKLILDLFLSSSLGFMIYFPSINPTSTEPVGPSKGMSEIERAIEEPIMATISGEWSWSTHNTVATICTSFLYPSGKRGLRGLSINLAESVAFSLGLPSLLINPPGIFPTAYIFSS